MRDQIEQVYLEISDHLRLTPLEKSPLLEQDLACQLHFKMENQQLTGSFKLRGVLSKFSGFQHHGINTSKVVAASTGNHALAVCHAAKVFNAVPIIFVPKTISKSKLRKLQSLEIDIRQQGVQSGETEQIAIEYARRNNLPLIHPYNDPEVIAGQGTIGLELTQQISPINQVFVPVGGGGLISGIASYLKAVNPETKIVGVQPRNACEMTDSIREDRIVEASTLSTISDGTAGGLDPATITFEFCKQLVDDFVLVEELEIVQALKLMEKHLGVMVEPSAGLALAGLLRRAGKIKGQSCICVVCGGNIDQQRYRELLREYG